MTTHATVNITARPTDRTRRRRWTTACCGCSPTRCGPARHRCWRRSSCAPATWPRRPGPCPSAVSNQLRHLREAGVVEREAAGRFIYYRLRPEVLAGLGAQFAALAAAARAAEKRPC